MILEQQKEHFNNKVQIGNLNIFIYSSGAGRGLGKCLALRLAQEGCDIAICDVNLNEAKETSEEIRKTFNVKSEAFKCDVRDAEQIKKLCDDIKNKFGYHVDILVLKKNELTVSKK